MSWNSAATRAVGDQRYPVDVEAPAGAPDIALDYQAAGRVDEFVTYFTGDNFTDGERTAVRIADPYVRAVSPEP